MESTTKRKGGKKVLATRVSDETPERIDEIAREFGFTRINNQGELVGACGILLDRIAEGKLKIVSVD